MQEHLPQHGENGVTTAARNDGFVVFDRVQKSYDGVSLVVKDLNLSIGKGELRQVRTPASL